MRVRVQVKPNASKNEIISEREILKVAIRAPAKEGKANLELVKFLKKYYGKPIKIVSGSNSRIKTLEIG